MTLHEYISKMESQLEDSLSDNLQKYIPAILERIEEIAMEKFIKEGDPVLDLGEFKKVFDRIITEALNRDFEKNKKLVIQDGLFETYILKDKSNNNMIFTFGLN